MRFVIDMNLSPAWADVLIEMGHHAAHWCSIGEIDAPDACIMEWARDHGSIVFTHDLDYGALLHATAATAPSVIQIRSEDVRPAILTECLKAALAACQGDLEAGALVTIDPRRWRMSLRRWQNTIDREFAVIFLESPPRIALVRLACSRTPRSSSPAAICARSARSSRSSPSSRSSASRWAWWR